MKRILLACPTSVHKKYCQEDWLNHISKLTYPVDILIIDNSKLMNDNFIELTKTANRLLKKNNNNVMVWYEKPVSRLKDTITNCCERIRKFAIAKKYDYWFSLESDVFPPFNIIEHLLSFDTLVSCSTYFHFGGDDSKLLQFTKDSWDGLLTHRFKEFNESFLTDFTFNQPKIVEQTGLGCLLCSVDVLKKLKFRIDESILRQGYHDFYFHIDLQRLGIKVYTDFNVTVEHRNNSKNWQRIKRLELNA